MAVYSAYPSCRICNLNADPGDTHCMSCGRSLSHDEEHKDSNDILLALVTQVNDVLASKTKGLFGAHRELKMNIVTGALCSLWMFSCLIVVNMNSFESAHFVGDTAVAVQILDQQIIDELEPSLQAAVEDR